MTDPSAPYLTGNGLALRCARYFPWQEKDPPALGQNPGADNDCIYVKADFVHAFFASRCVPSSFTLLTHNSDVAIGEEHRRHLDDSRLRLWLAQNVAVSHPKLKAISIGIANANYAHGDARALDRVRALKIPKTKLFHAAYSVGTDTDDSRARCLRETGVPLDPPKPFEEYLQDLASAYFCISPRGRGIDCHRTWEALYVGTIPVVEQGASRSKETMLFDTHANGDLLWRDHPSIPRVALEDWADFRRVDFSPLLYDWLWNRFDPKVLEIDTYCQNIKAKYGVSL